MECRLFKVASRPCMICPCPFYPVLSLASSSVPLNNALPSVLLISLSTVSAFPKGLGHSTPSAWSTVTSSLSNFSSLYRSHMKHCFPGEPSLPSAWPGASCKPRTLPLSCAHQGCVFPSVRVNIGLKFTPFLPLQLTLLKRGTGSSFAH